MTLTVRLDDALQAALDQHCALNGVTKTLVVQESLARYLVTAQAGAAGGAATASGSGITAPPSAAFKAFTDAGLIGSVATGSAPADKAAVRRQALLRMRQAEPRVPAAPDTKSGHGR